MKDALFYKFRRPTIGQICSAQDCNIVSDLCMCYWVIVFIQGIVLCRLLY